MRRVGHKGERRQLAICLPDRTRAAFYTIFSQEPDGSWQRQIEVRARSKYRLRWDYGFLGVSPFLQMALRAEEREESELHANPAEAMLMRHPPGPSNPASLDDCAVEEWLRIGGD